MNVKNASEKKNANAMSVQKITDLYFSVRSKKDASFQRKGSWLSVVVQLTSLSAAC